MTTHRGFLLTGEDVRVTELPREGGTRRWVVTVHDEPSVEVRHATATGETWCECRERACAHRHAVWAAENDRLYAAPPDVLGSRLRPCPACAGPPVPVGMVCPACEGRTAERSEVSELTSDGRLRSSTRAA